MINVINGYYSIPVIKELLGCFWTKLEKTKAEAMHDKGRQCMKKAKANENGKAIIRQGKARQGKSRQLKGEAKAKARQDKARRNEKDKTWQVQASSGKKKAKAKTKTKTKAKTKVKVKKGMASQCNSKERPRHGKVKEKQGEEMARHG